MYIHEPPGYTCPFCFLLASGQTPIDGSRHRGAHPTRHRAGRIGLVAHNPGHVLVISNAHHENL
ncbi:histidine triad (HIT) family protein [Amycolatopsis tolypomycina]|uniref:Histidine triad (HIT) family protein n=1 Tax=Amycolatopsis tolypomycina TaxID=208445 RepID=A0A1H4JJR7_9PSEU|nr:hypothetical protein [Amycolatopsis tolypomycina]SEB46541.1 histidine triad (HIT) family protein [Amycolatopsis tolypomycina]